MKKVMLIYGLLMLTLGILNAQSGSRFPIDSTSIWRIDHIQNGRSDEKNHLEGDEIYKYYIQGDTIIDFKIYFKIFKTGTAYLDVPFTYTHIYAGALRDENNRFYFVEKNKSEEVLLYNFNAQIDDTIKVPYMGAFEDKVVSSIDTLPDGRKIIHFNPKEPIIGCGDQYMMEGIGGSGGLLEGPACFHAWTSDNHLVCYMQNGFMIYHDNNFDFNCEISDDQAGTTIDSTCIWRVDKQIITDTVSDFEKLNYFICGDTLIGALHYLKLCKTGMQLYIEKDGSFASGIHHDVYIGALRENESRIYFIGKDDQVEALLYNFSLQPGNIVDGMIYHEDTVKTVDLLLDNRKAFFLSNDHWQHFIIEGIGSDKGLLESQTEYSTLVCFMKNDASVYHNGTGSECTLTFDNMNFAACDQIKIIPENPTVTDEIKLVARLCYQVSYNHPVSPVISSKLIQAEGQTINLEFYCDYDDQVNDDSMKILYPLFDTIAIGCLEEGEYYTETIVHTIHHAGDETDTTFYDKSQYSWFTVSPSHTHVPEILNEKSFKVYPVPARDHVIIENRSTNCRINSVELYSVLGSGIKTMKIDNKGDMDVLQLDIRNLESGFYLLKICSSDFCYTQKIIKE